MDNIQAIGRQTEINLLKKYASSNQAEFIAVYGRRRVGKTYLIHQVFDSQMVFDVSGVLNGNKDDQFSAFNNALRRIGYEGKYTEKWMDAFFALEQTIAKRISDNRRHVIFIDELPCFDVYGTRFVAALGHFWNDFVVKHKNLMLIICGSATSWIVNNIVDNHGGLHNRITHDMHLHPFSLGQCEQYARSRHFIWDRLSIMQAYMVFGGIPYYYSLIEQGESVSQAIDRLVFSQEGELHNEYNRLFSSLFHNPEPYRAIIEALAKHRYGLTRNELAKKVGKSDGGNLSKQLDDLIKCDFIRYQRVKTKKISKTGGIYSLADFFTQFHHTFLTSESSDAHYWTHNMLSPIINSFYGLSFERVCMSHIDNIKRAIGIDRIGTEFYSWRSSNPLQQAQIDLIIERADRIINLCEIKFSTTPYTIDKAEDMRLRIRQAAFVSQTKTRYGIQPTFITTFGLERNAYANSIMTQVTMDDLFKEVIP